MVSQNISDAVKVLGFGQRRTLAVATRSLDELQQGLVATLGSHRELVLAK